MHLKVLGPFMIPPKIMCIRSRLGPGPNGMQFVLMNIITCYVLNGLSLNFRIFVKLRDEICVVRKVYNLGCHLKSKTCIVVVNGV